jgi:tRNA (cmo5U34)-methyltransferase
MNESWTFEDQKVVDKFDSHVREQLPWYDMVTDAVIYIIRNYLAHRKVVVDIGASTGNLMAKIMPLLEERFSTGIAIDRSESMCCAMDDKFGEGSIIKVDYRDVAKQDVPDAQIYILFLTLMFIPVVDREKLMKRLIDQCEVGGCIIVVDKIADHSGYFGTVLKRLTMHFKLLQGAKPEDVLEKEMCLAGVQIPIALEILGNKAKLFFRMGEFAGWVIEK